MLISQLVDTVDGEVEVKLLGDRSIRPRRLLPPIHLLEREAATTVGSKEQEPVGALGVRYHREARGHSCSDLSITAGIGQETVRQPSAQIIPTYPVVRTSGAALSRRDALPAGGGREVRSVAERSQSDD